MQLGIALYYGEIGNIKDGESEDLICHTKDMLGNVTGKCNFCVEALIYLLFTNISDQG